MPYTIPSSVISPGAVYQPRQIIPVVISQNARALYYTRGGSISDSLLLDQSPLNSGTRRTGEEGRCVDLNGTNQAVRIADNTALDITDNLTVMAWVKNTNATTTGEYVLTKYDTGVNKREWAFGYNSSQKLFANIGSSDGSAFTSQTSDAAVSIDSWNHVAFTFSAGSVALYVNGSLVASTASASHPASLNNEDADLIVGAGLSSNALASLWDGQIFDARIYAGDSTVLTAAQIQSIYADGPNNVQFAGQTLRAHYKLDEQSGSTCYDSSGNSNNGTIENAVSNWGVTQGIWSFQNQVGFNKRMYFDGVDDNITLGIGDPLGFNGASKIGIKFKIIPVKSPSSPEFIFTHFLNNAIFGGVVVGYNNSFQISFGGRSIESDTYQSAISTNTISPSLLNTVEIYFDYQNDEMGVKVNNNDFETFPVSYSSLTYVTTNTTINTFIAATTSAFGKGVLLDFEFYKNDLLIHSYSGHGNNASNWIDQIGSINGTVNGSPSNHFLPRAEGDTSNDIFGQTLENTGRRPNDAALHSSNCLTADGTLYIAAAHLAGTETVVSSGGTSTPSISAGRIDFTAGTCWDLTLSDGTHYPLSEGGGIGIHDDSGSGNHGILTNAVLANAWGGSQDSYNKNLSDGFVYAYQPAKQVFTGAQAANITGISFKVRSTDAYLLIFNDGYILPYLFAAQAGSSSTELGAFSGPFIISVDGSSAWGTTRDQLHSAVCDGNVHNITISPLNFNLNTEWITNGIFVNSYTGLEWDSTTYLWDLQATDSNGDPIYPADPDVRLPAVTSSLGPYSIPLTDLPSNLNRNRAETLIDFDPDSTPEMGATQLGITVPASHAFGDVFAASTQIFSRQRTLTEDRFVVMPEAQTGSALATIQKYTQP